MDLFDPSMTDLVPDTTALRDSLRSFDEFYWMVDVMLEGLNIMGGAAAYSFFDIGLKIWEPLAKMDIGYIPEDMDEFKKALYLNKLKVYERKFTKPTETDDEGAGAIDDHDHNDEI